MWGIKASLKYFKVSQTFIKLLIFLINVTLLTHNPHMVEQNIHDQRILFFSLSKMIHIKMIFNEWCIVLLKRSQSEFYTLQISFLPWKMVIVSIGYCSSLSKKRGEKSETTSSYYSIIEYMRRDIFIIV